MDELKPEDVAEMKAAVGAMATAWNEADAEGFARPFWRDAEFVDIKTVRDSGREEIRKRHAWLFGGVFRGSRVAYDVLDFKLLAPGVALAHVTAALDTKDGRIDTLASCVFKREDMRWQLAVFHNTQVGQYATEPLPA